ncbi:PepSY domain-containing protein [uncultured Marixanthomonas sp.]|uniref:PepSY domain-containing protein n=1 Tax=uncultured Marixanthomonas sp. TaxID=757245 RepID=UPI0030DB5022
MTLSIWRYSHLALAVSSFVFIVIASVTGIILAVEPVSEQLKPFAIPETQEISVGETVAVLQNKYDEVLWVEVDHNDFVSASVITAEGNSETFYINPITGEKVGELIEQHPIFSFATNVHRSLFLKSTGRFIVGLISFLLFIIAVTGVLLIVKRQGSVKRFFSKISKESFNQHYHVYFGRLFLIPIIILTVTGVYLSLEKFSLLPEYKVTHQVDYDTIAEMPVREVIDFPAFQDSPLTDLKRLEFPFSPAPEDYYIAKFSNKEVLVNQFTGEVLSEFEYPFVAWASSWSMALHTGRGSIVWSVILLIACCSILFFIYSGFAMTLRRRKKTKAFKNKHTKDESEYIILVGSETGNTFDFVRQFQKALLQAGRKVFVSELNTYTTYKKARQLFVFTATYGQGEAPANATNFLQLLEKKKQNHPIHFSVIGFGSLAYEDYCQFAIDVDKALQQHPNFHQELPIYKINNQDATDFEHWAIRWATQHNLHLQLEPLDSGKKVAPQHNFTVINRTELNRDDTFLLQLRPTKKQVFESGDLLEIIPPNERIARLYSIAEVAGDIVLSIKRHEYGACSSYFSSCKVGEKVKGVISKNESFHLPDKAQQVLLIANGTGIAPFLGMIATHAATKEINLFWGGKTQESFNLYASYLEETNLQTTQLAYSQEGNKQYVQDRLVAQKEMVAHLLQENAMIMICGSIAMQKEVLSVLENILTEYKMEVTINDLEQQGFLAMDCY